MEMCAWVYWGGVEKNEGELSVMPSVSGAGCDKRGSGWYLSLSHSHIHTLCERERPCCVPFYRPWVNTAQVCWGEGSDCMAAICRLHFGAERQMVRPEGGFCRKTGFPYCSSRLSVLLQGLFHWDTWPVAFFKQRGIACSVLPASIVLVIFSISWTVSSYKCLLRSAPLHLLFYINRRFRHDLMFHLHRNSQVIKTVVWLTGELASAVQH